MRRIYGGLVAGLLLALGFSAPAAATADDAITFTFTDGCGYVETKVTNNTAVPVQYRLATIFNGFTFDMGPLDFTLALGATKTHRWPVRFHHGVRASSQALTAPIDHLYQQEAACNTLWPQPGFLQDCNGKALVQIAEFHHPELGDPVFALNGKPGKPFSPDQPHFEFFEGLKPGDVVSFLVPALTEPHELITWYQPDYRDLSSRCSHMPPVTVTSTCAGINLKTVNTEQASELKVASPADRRFLLAQGAALDENLPADDGSLVVVFWDQAWDRETGEKPAAVLAQHVKPPGCDAPPVSGGPVSGGPLAVTGAPTWLLLSAGGLLLAMGIGLLGVTRRRRVRVSSQSD